MLDAFRYRPTFVAEASRLSVVPRRAELLLRQAFRSAQSTQRSISNQPLYGQFSRKLTKTRQKLASFIEQFRLQMRLEL